MSARFRIRTSQGQELSFATHEMFAEFVRSGDLSPDDVVYDAETKEWAPSRTHPLVLQLELEAEEAAAAEAQAETTEADADPQEADVPSEESEEDADLGLELAPAPSELSSEEATAKFVAQLEAERAADLDFDEGPDTGSFRIDAGPASIVEEISEPPPPPRPPPRPPPKTRREPLKKAPERKKKKKGSGKFGRYAPFLIMAGVLAAVGGYFGPTLLAPATGAGTETPPDPGNGTPPPPPPVIAATPEALRERAQERYLGTTRALLRDLQPIPPTWLSGPYLAAPSDHVDARAIWAEYLTTIREVRTGDEARYRAGYTVALDDAAIQGEARSQRLTAALAQFQASQADRVAHYDRVEALASAAISGHDALVDAEGSISVGTAISGPAATADPPIEAVGRGQEAQALLDQVLELLLLRLDGQGGPGEAANVREWVYDGLLDAVTN